MKEDRSDKFTSEMQAHNTLEEAKASIAVRQTKREQERKDRKEKEKNV